MRSLSVSSSAREEMIDITSKVAAMIQAEENHPAAEASAPLLRKERSFMNGVVVLFTQHTTCGLTINENADPDVQSDMLGFLKRLVPQFPERGSWLGADTPTEQGEFKFRHFEHNSDAHIKSSLVGSSVTVPFEDGKLMLGRWQGIYLCEFDGPRERRVLVQVLTTED